MKYIEKNEEFFILRTKNTTYSIMVKNGYLLHAYYGEKIGDVNLEKGTLANRTRAIAVYEKEYAADFTLCNLPLEISFFDYGDYRSPSVKIYDEEGNILSDFHYAGYEITAEKRKIVGMPCARNAEDGETLTLILKSDKTDVETWLVYTVYPEIDVITRRIEIINGEEKAFSIEKCVSATMDFTRDDFDIVTLRGAQARERAVKRFALPDGRYIHDSVVGASGHFGTPFAMLCDANANENEGGVYGFNLVYSGNFAVETEKDGYRRTRLSIGINPDNFLYTLGSGERFYSPEVATTYSASGFNGVSIAFADFAREYIMPRKFAKKDRQIVINSWEGMSFDITEEKLLAFAKEAKAMGMETLVVDDGWFSTRRWDDKGLGDWYVAKEIFPNGLPAFSQQIEDLGMKFGIWIEPEMVNPDSDLFRNHPDWVLGQSDKFQSRNQLVLDLSNPEVVDYIFESLKKAFDGVKLSYVKWDCNRGIMPYRSVYTKKNKEVMHRQMLGVYSLMEKLTSHFKDVLFEGCACGGGRYDLGVLYYFPQIWASDNTDAFNRCYIQHGASYFAPVSSMSCHVTKPCNIGTRHLTSVDFRGGVAFNGAFGYELQVNELSDEDKATFKAQIIEYKTDVEDLVLNGDFYRLASPVDSELYAYAIIAKDKSHGIFNASILYNFRNHPDIWVKVYGLDENASYEINGQILSGKAWRTIGLRLPAPDKSGQSFRFKIVKV